MADDRNGGPGGVGSTQFRRAAALGGAALGALVLAAGAARAQSVPFSENFESRTPGVLAGQNGWSAQRQNDAQVQSVTVFAGSRAVAVSTNAAATCAFSNPAATNVWIDFYARPPQPPDSGAPALSGSVAAAFFMGNDGKLRAVSNNTWVTLGAVTLQANRWYRFSVNLDYAASKWALYVANDTPNALATPVATNLAFSASNTNRCFRGFRIRN